MSKDLQLKKAIAREKAKCKLDPVYFIKNHCTIQHPVRGKIKFELYPFQEDVLHDLQEFRYNICLKSRQIGISTLSAAFALWRMVFWEDYSVLVIATKQTVAKNLVTKVRIMNDYLPSYLKLDCIENNKLNLRYSNGSQIKAVSSSPDAARSEALSLLIIDEAAFVPKAEEVWTAAQSTLSTGGKVFVLSTPAGVGNMFHRLWTEAETGYNDFNTIKLKWDVHPDRDQKWRDEQTKILGEQAAAQELDCSFLTSGYSVISGTTLDKYEKEICREPVQKRGIGEDLWIWKFPEYDKQYIVTADVARGDGLDYSAFHVLDIVNLEQVASFKAQVSTRELARMLFSIGMEYNKALVVVENANVGWDVLNTLIEDGYENLFYTYKNDPFFDRAIQLQKRYDLVDKKECVPGFTTSSKTRPVIISKLEEYFREETVIVRDKRTITELYTFIWKDGKAEAMEGHNDDLAMALAIALWVRDTALRMKAAGIELSKKMIGSFSKGFYKSTDGDKKAQGWDFNPQPGVNIDLTHLLR